MKRSVVILTLLMTFMAVVSSVSAQENLPPMDTITVIGTGSAAGSPDIATLEIGVEIRNEDIAIAFSETNNTIDDVIAAMVEAGVAREDIRTTGLNIYRDMYGNPMSSGMVGEGMPVYVVSNNIRITIRDIANVADVINAAVASGATNIYGLNFGIDNRATLESQARADAIADARTRAEELASLAGAELGDIVIISEYSGGYSPFDLMNLAAPRIESGFGGGAAIEPGQLSVTVQVQVTFRINR